MSENTAYAEHNKVLPKADVDDKASKDTKRFTVTVSPRNQEYLDYLCDRWEVPQSVAINLAIKIAAHFAKADDDGSKILRQLPDGTIVEVFLSI